MGSLAVSLWLALAVRIQVQYPVLNCSQALRFSVFVEPAPAQRQMYVEVSGDSYYRSSLYELREEAGPRQTRVEWGQMPPGDYVIAATVANQSGKTLQVGTGRVTVGGC